MFKKLMNSKKNLISETLAALLSLAEEATKSKGGHFAKLK